MKTMTIYGMTGAAGGQWVETFEVREIIPGGSRVTSSGVTGRSWPGTTKGTREATNAIAQRNGCGPVTDAQYYGR